MASTQAVWGIDLGRCALKTLKLRVAADDGVEILAHDHIEHAKILSQPDADRNELIRAALEKFLSRNDISKDQVVVSVPGQHTLARFTKLPPVAPKRIPDIVRYEADQQIPFDMDEVIWDYQTFQQEGLPDLEVGIFAMKRELVREHLLHFEQAAIEPIAVQSSPLAVYNAAQFDGMLGKETTILIDIGADNTDLIIATPGSFWTRTVPIGGNNFTTALVKAFKLSFSKAENLKRTAESSKYARQIFQAMRPVFADLVQELQRSIGFYSSTHRDTKVEKVVCVGNAFKLPGLRKYLQQNLGLPVERLDSFKRAALVGAASAASAEFKEHLLGFGAAYGLALQGLDLGQVSSNLLPTEIAKQLAWQKKRPAFAAAAACLLLAGGLVFFRQYTDMRALAGGAELRTPAPKDADAAWDIIRNGPSPALPERARAGAILAAGQTLKRELGTLRGQGETERRQTEELIAIQKNKTLVPRILQVIHESVPRPKGPLGEATTQQQVLEAIAAGAPPRGRRKQVFLEKLLMHFEPDLNKFKWESMVSVPDPINDPDAELPGIKIEITCRTPNEDGVRFIRENFMERLRANGRRADQGFYFDRVYLYDGRKVETAGSSSGPSLRGPVPGRRGFGSVARPAAPTSATTKDVDPVTNEPIEGDWRFEIWVDAILEDYPGDEEGASEGDDD